VKKMSEQVHRKEDSVGSGSVAAGNQGQQEPAKMQSVNLSYQQQQPHPYNPAQQFVYVPGQSVPIIPSSNGGFIQQIRPQDNPNVFAQFIPVNYLQGQANQQYNASQPGNFPMKFMPGFQFYQHPMQVMPQQIVCVPNMNQPPHVQVSSKDSPRKSPNIQDNLEAKAPAHSELKSEQISDSTEDTEDEEEAEYEEDKNEMKRNLASENNFSEFKKPHSPQRSFGSMAAAEAEAVDAMLNSSNIQVSDDRDPHSDNDQKVTGKSLDTKKHYENSGKKRKMDNNTNENIEEREVYSVSKSVGSVKSITEEDESGRSADEYIYTQIYGEPLKTECIKCQNEFLYPRGHEKVRCPHCSEVVEVPSPQETEESKKIGKELEIYSCIILNNILFRTKIF
jgi:LSD1 subclass zinc finger protein